MSVVRSIETVLFTDIVGSTERLATLGDRGWRDVRAGHHAAVRKELRRFGGREVNTAGDGFLVLFDNPADAIRCARAIQEDVRELGLELRAGVHLGEVEAAGNDVGGLAVHIGARVAAAAAPGEVWVSSTVRDAEAGSGFLFEDRGAHDLKGVPGEWRLFAATGLPRADDVQPERRPRRASGPAALSRLRWPRPQSSRTRVAAAATLLVATAAVFAWIRAQGGAAGPAVAVAGSAGPGLAVLPFTVNDPELGPWREGMVDLLSTNLDGAAGLRAIDSRTTLARWRETASGDEPPPLEAALGVARRTGARYALAGSAVEIGSRVRLAADVFDLADGSRLGQARVEGSPDSVFALVDRLSIDVLRTILRSPREELPRVRLASVTTESLPALRAYLEGEVAFRRSDWNAAGEAYERAVEADSGFALALQRLAHVYGWSEGLRSELVSSNQERAWRHADRLPARERLLLESDQAVDRGDLRAFDLLRRATREYPDDPAAWYLLGDAVYHLGPAALATKRDAVRALEESIRLDPGFSPAYIHLLQLGIEHPADSARVTRLLAVRARQTPGLRGDDPLAYAVSLAFGDSATRVTVHAELARRPPRTAMDVVHSLVQPRFAEALRTPLRLHGRVGDAVGEHLLLHEAMLHIARGRVRDAVGIVDRLALTEAREPALSLLHVAHVQGVPMPPRGFELMRGAAQTDTASAQLAFHAAVLAADDGRWANHAALLRRLTAWRADAVAQGDSSRARFLAGTAAALNGYAAWRGGRHDEALRVLQAAQRDAVENTVPGTGVNPVVRWWLGTLLFERRRLREAEPYFTSFWDDALASSSLARLYEELDEPQRARASWAEFAELWRDADPELQPRVTEARAAVQRLTSVVRE